MPNKTLQIRNSLSQKLMAALFDCTPENIIIHLKNIFADGKLDEFSVTKDFLVTAGDSKKLQNQALQP